MLNAPLRLFYYGLMGAFLMLLPNKTPKRKEQQIMKVLRKNGEIVEVSFKEQEGKKAFWHTSAHVLAQAVKRLYLETKCAIDPAIENGFYYDYDFAFSFSEEHLKAIKLLSVAGAYWRGNEKNPMLTRMYGISFPKASQLEEYLHVVEEAKARDHRKLGKELGIFTIFDEGPGLPVFLPKGMVLKNLLIDYWRKIHRRDGY